MSRTLEQRLFQALEQITNAVIVSGDNSLGVLSFHSEGVMHVEGNATVQALVAVGVIRKILCLLLCILSIAADCTTVTSS